MLLSSVGQLGTASIYFRGFCQVHLVLAEFKSLSFICSGNIVLTTLPLLFFWGLGTVIVGPIISCFKSQLLASFKTIACGP